MKIIVSPFLWFLFFQGAGLVLLLRWGSIKSNRSLIRLLLVLVFLLAIISTPLSGNWLKNTLSIHPTEKSTAQPVAIFVLAGGYLQGATSDEDDPTTPIGIVTSDWHMRRAEQEFRRYFQKVYTYPLLTLRGTQGLQSLMPAADSLDDNTTLLREWVGILWYKIRCLAVLGG